MRSIHRTLWRFAAVALAGAFALGACGGDDGGGGGNEASKSKFGGSFVGKVEGTDAFVGIVADEDADEALAYVCDSAGITEWFHPGVRNGDEFSAVSPDGSVLVATGGKDAFEGQVILADGAHAFTADKATGDAGLFRLQQTVDGTDYLAGWVELPDGTFRGDVTRTGLRSPLESNTLDASTEAPPPPPSTAAPTTTTPPPAPPISEQGTPASDAIASRFPTDPPPDAQVLSASAPVESGVPGGGDTTVTTEAGQVAPTTAPPETEKATPEQCAKFNDQLTQIQDEIGETLMGLQTRRKKKERKELNAAFNALGEAAAAAGCAVIGGSFN